MLDVKVRNKNVKSKLSFLFGAKNVSVTNGKGTAWGWCHININVNKEQYNIACTCNDNEPGYCDPCAKLYRKIEDTAQKAISNIEFFNYSDDMNYNHQEVITQIHLV